MQNPSCIYESDLTNQMQAGYEYMARINLELACEGLKTYLTELETYEKTIVEV